MTTQTHYLVCSAITDPAIQTQSVYCPEGFYVTSTQVMQSTLDIASFTSISTMTLAIVLTCYVLGASIGVVLNLFRSA